MSSEFYEIGGLYIQKFTKPTQGSIIKINKNWNLVSRMVQVWVAHVALLLLFCQGVGDSFLSNNWGRGGH